MARKAREKSSTGVYAVILRGSKDVFKEKRYRDRFQNSISERFGDRAKGLRFYDDSVHMLLCESEKGISVDMKPVIISFARMYNREQGCEGKVFKDRFRSVPVESAETETECIRYLNGGKKAEPFMMRGEAGAPSPVRKRKEEGKTKKTENTEVYSAPEPKPVQEKPKKKDQMPTWLL